MQNSKIMISQALNTIHNNLKRTGDPLGLKTVYWTQWAEHLEMPKESSPLFYTARMYQMLPFLVQATKMIEKAKPLVPLLSVKSFSKLAEITSTVAIDPFLRLHALRARNIRNRAETALCGIVAGLANIGIHPSYLYDKEPYSGVLLYDLELEETVNSIANSVYKKLQTVGTKHIVTVDPHTTHMLRHVYPHYISNYDLKVTNYLELLAESQWCSSSQQTAELPKKLVIHDSCVMTRELGIVEPIRTILNRLGIEVEEPEDSGINTACCGGPIEYAYPDLSWSISEGRAKELSQISHDVVVTCPICLINLMKHEQALDLRVWDMGEILYLALQSNLKKIE